MPSSGREISLATLRRFFTPNGITPRSLRRRGRSAAPPSTFPSAGAAGSSRREWARTQAASCGCEPRRRDELGARTVEFRRRGAHPIDSDHRSGQGRADAAEARPVRNVRRDNRRLYRVVGPGRGRSPAGFARPICHKAWRWERPPKLRSGSRTPPGHFKSSTPGGRSLQEVKTGAAAARAFTLEISGEVTVIDRAAAGRDRLGPAVEIGGIVVREDGRATVPVIAKRPERHRRRQDLYGRQGSRFEKHRSVRLGGLAGKGLPYVLCSRAGRFAGSTTSESRTR